MKLSLCLFVATIAQCQTVSGGGGSASGAAAGAGVGGIAVPGLVTVMSQSLLPNNTDCNTAQCEVSPSGTVTYHLADPSLAGNALVMTLTASPNGGGCAIVASDITDDQSNTWTAGPSGQNSTDSQYAFIFYALNAAANTYTVTFHNAHCGSTYTTGVQAHLAQFRNIATLSASDGSGCNSGSSTTPSSGSFTPTVSGDLILSYAFRTNTQPNAVSSWTAGSGFTLAAADTLDGSALQYEIQSVAAAINPGFTMGSTSRWVSCALALKAASSGSDIATSKPTLRGIFHETFVKGSADTQTVAIPCRGNEVVAMVGGNWHWLLNSMSDSNSNTWTQVNSQVNNSGLGGNTNEGTQMWRATNLTCSSALTITLVWNDTTQGHGGILFYDIAGAATPNSFDVDVSAQGIQGGSAGTALTSAPSGITPGASNTLLLCEMPVFFNTVGGASNITGVLFDASTYSGENHDGPEPLDQNNGWAHAYLSGTTTQSLTWSQFYLTGNSFAGWQARCSTWK